MEVSVRNCTDSLRGAISVQTITKPPTRRCRHEIRWPRLPNVHDELMKANTCLWNSEHKSMTQTSLSEHQPRTVEPWSPRRITLPICGQIICKWCQACFWKVSRAARHLLAAKRQGFRYQHVSCCNRQEALCWVCEGLAA